MLAAARAEIAKGERTWTAGQVADWVAEQYGVRISPGRMRVQLKRAKLSYQRTARTLKHKQQPEEVAERKAELGELEKKGLAV
jgi:putative transposase